MYPLLFGRDEVVMSDVNANISRAELAQLRSNMLRFARLQLRDAAAAEDAVQDAMLAAMSKMADFRGNAQLSSWVFAILKNKIIDIMRSRKRFTSSQEVDELPADSFDALFDERDRWQVDERPTFWGDPEATLEQQNSSSSGRSSRPASTGCRPRPPGCS